MISMSEGAKGGVNIAAIAKKNTVWLVLIVMVIVVSIATGGSFVTPVNISNLLTTEAIKAMLTVGVMFTILAKGIDISTAAVLALSATVSASLCQQIGPDTLLHLSTPMPAFVGLIAGVAVAAVVGFCNGFFIAYTKIPPFIATLGAQLVVKGIALLYTNAYPVANLTPGFKIMGQGFLIPKVPNVVTVAVVVVIIGGVLLTQTRFGKNIFAIGGNDIAAKVAGIKVEKNLILAYTFCSCCAGLGGVLLASRSGSGIATLGFNYELDAIAAATVGGTSHTGGVARISGVIAGILILGVINNGLLILGVSPYIQQIVKGGIIVGAVVWDMRKHAKKA
ncbi:MAG: hypothetical protein LBN22_02160 [Clostridiales Family XIII bacterium]|jgi:ribose/xylose/arabinose/galactoside ABC-type transport system permease subunit|nr:hypothetical protein [Clostridiales Family XIII bacterium]